MSAREDDYSIDRAGSLVRSVVPRRGYPYQHRCTMDVYKRIAHVIDERGEPGFTVEDLIAWEDVPSSQAATVLAFLKERGCIVTEGKRNYPAGKGVYEDAMVEYFALLDKQDTQRS